jgi:hypothetical protein
MSRAVIISVNDVSGKLLLDVRCVTKRSSRLQTYPMNDLLSMKAGFDINSISAFVKQASDAPSCAGSSRC